MNLGKQRVTPPGQSTQAGREHQRWHGQGWHGQRGSEPVSFALLVPLLLLGILGVMQLSLCLWIRTTLIDAAVAGAHSCAVAGASPDAAEVTVRQSLASTLGKDYVHRVEVSQVALSSVSTAVGSSQVGVVEVRITTHVPVIGVFGFGDMSVVGHAFQEVGPQ